MSKSDGAKVTSPLEVTDKYSNEEKTVTSNQVYNLTHWPMDYENYVSCVDVTAICVSYNNLNMIGTQKALQAMEYGGQAWGDYLRILRFLAIVLLIYSCQSKL